MPDRDFAFVKTVQEGVPQSAFRITCVCGKSFDFRQTANRRLPSAAAAQYFRNHGWSVGGGPKADRCPSCTEMLTQSRRTSKTVAGPKPILIAAAPEVRPMKPVLNVVSAMAGPGTEPPMEMSREERRIIFAKLNEVYISEQVGYDKGWSDQRVSEDLGVPRAWIAMLRQENFGDAKDNEDIQKFMDASAKFAVDAEAVMVQAKAAMAAAEALKEASRSLSKLAIEVKKQMY